MTPPGDDKWPLCWLKHNSLVLQQDTAFTPASYLTLRTVVGSAPLSGRVERLTASYARASLATQRAEYSAGLFSKSLESVYLSASTHPYHQACSTALHDEECQREENEEEDEKEALWTALICIHEHTWLLHRLMPHSANTSGGAYEQTGSIFLHPTGPSRPILLAVDKRETLACTSRPAVITTNHLRARHHSRKLRRQNRCPCERPTTSVSIG